MLESHAFLQSEQKSRVLSSSEMSNELSGILDKGSGGQGQNAESDRGLQAVSALLVQPGQNSVGVHHRHHPRRRRKRQGVVSALGQ